MALLDLTLTSSGSSFSLDELDVIKMYTKDSQTVIEAVYGELSITKIFEVDETASSIQLASTKLFSTTYNNGTVYLNAGRINSVDEVNSLARVSYDNNGDTPELLRLDVDKATFEASIPSDGKVNNIIEAKVSLSAAQIRNGNSTPIEAIAAQGAGTAIEVDSCSMNYTHNGVSFDTGANFEIGTNSSVAQFIDWNGGSIIQGTTSAFVKCEQFDSGGNSQIDENEPLNIQVDNDSTVGDGTADFYIAYRVVTL